MERKNYLEMMKSLINKIPTIGKTYQEPQVYFNFKDEYVYTQRNNIYKKLSACMPTSRVMYYLGNGIDLSFLDDVKGDMAYDDYFMSLLDSDEAHAYADKYLHSLYEATGHSPQEIHDMYYWLEDKLFGKRISKFYFRTATWNDYIKWIKAGKVIMTSGRMPRIGPHAFCVIGYDEFDNTLILVDPYGNYHLKYDNDNSDAKKGYKIRMSQEDFHSYINGYRNGKFAHVVIKEL